MNLLAGMLIGWYTDTWPVRALWAVGWGFASCAFRYLALLAGVQYLAMEMARFRETEAEGRVRSAYYLFFMPAYVAAVATSLLGMAVMAFLRWLL